MRKAILSVFTVCLCLVCWNAIAQNPAPSPTPSALPTASAPTASAPTASAPSPASSARPGDVDTVEHIIAAVYDVISGPAGPRDWDRFRSLYYPGARMVPSRRDDKGAVTARIFTPDEYASRSQ